MSLKTQSLHICTFIIPSLAHCHLASIPPPTCWLSPKPLSDAPWGQRQWMSGSAYSAGYRNFTWLRVFFPWNSLLHWFLVSPFIPLTRVGSLNVGVGSGCGLLPFSLLTLSWNNPTHIGMFETPKLGLLPRLIYKIYQLLLGTQHFPHFEFIFSRAELSAKEAE